MGESFVASGIVGQSIADDLSSFGFTFRLADGTEQKIAIPVLYLSAIGDVLERVREEQERRQAKRSAGEILTRVPANVYVHPLPMQAAVGLVFDQGTTIQTAYMLQPDQAKDIGRLLVRISDECTQLPRA
jgi:hypothetical protein